MENFWEESNSEEEQVQQPIKTGNNPFAIKKPAYNIDSESDEDDRKRVVKAPKEKMMDLIKEKYYKIRDSIDDKNYFEANGNFDEISKNLDKIKSLFKEKFPDIVLRILYLIEGSLEISKEERSKLSQRNNTAFNSLKKTYTKHIKNYDELLKAYKSTNPSEEDLIELADQ